MKKLMILGGSSYILPVIETAHRLGAYVITCDYLPDNTAHKYSDEYCNVSVMDREAVLGAAMARNIDGILSFACDPGVVAAAYVAERMGLPFQGSYESVSVLQEKGVFRKFLADHGFNCPHAKRYTDMESPFRDIDFFQWPVIVKPVDSAGSKGVTRVDSPDKLKEAIAVAVSCSHSHAFIIEDFLTFEGCHSSTDVFTVDGEVKFISYSDQLFDPEADNAYTPARIIWPSTMEDGHQAYLSLEIQRLMSLLKMRTGIYNIESCVDSNGRPYIMEVSPRGGGCRIAEIQKLAFGVDLIEAEVRSALGYPLNEVRQTECDGCWCEMVLHARAGESGAFRRLQIDPQIERKYVKNLRLSVKPGDMVHPFTGANMSLGDMFLRFDSREELDRVMGDVHEWMKIETEGDETFEDLVRHCGGGKSK